MSEIEMLVLGRVIERIFIVLICGASLGFGWNLFREGITNDQEAEFSKGNWKVALKQVGPGVFFALFACVGLAFAISSPLTLNPISPPSPSPEAKIQTPGLTRVNYDISTGNDKNAREEIKAINTLTTLWHSDASPSTAAAEKQAGDQAAVLLLQQKERLLRGIFPGDYEKYEAIRHNVESHPEVLSNMSPAERAQFDHIAQVSNDNFINSTTK
jgi:hypothetical protein